MILAEAARLAGFIWRHPANAGRRWSTMGKALWWQVYKRVTGRAVDLRVFGGLTFRCYPDSHASSLLLYCNGYPDFHEMRFMERYLRLGDRFIDAGANVGAYTVLAAACVTAAGRVDAYEPDPRSVKRLRENVFNNALTSVHVHEAVVADTSGTVRFLDDRDTENRIALDEDGTATGALRPCVCLDDLLSTGPYVMGKMDLEGSEILALRGASRGLAAGNPPVWLLEFNDSMARFDMTPERLRDWLGSYGYDLGLYDARTNELSFGASPWRQGQNVFAISRQGRATIAERLRTSAQPTADRTL